jgi:hypothetical protein
MKATQSTGIRTCKMTHASCGGVTLFAISVDDGTIGWGQGASNSKWYPLCTLVHVLNFSYLQASSVWARTSRRAQPNLFRWNLWLVLMSSSAFSPPQISSIIMFLLSLDPSQYRRWSEHHSVSRHAYRREVLGPRASPCGVRDSGRLHVMWSEGRG